MIIRKIKSLFRRVIRAIRKTQTSLSAAKQLKDLAGTTENPFFVIVMPGSLHILKVFMRYAPETVDFVLILNGVNQWEKTWLQSSYPGFCKIILKTTLNHGPVMDLIIDNFGKPFGMIDSDCFVFKSDYFDKMQVLEEDVLLNALFCIRNEEIDLEIPQTYFLFFNPKLISVVKKKYHVNCDQYHYGKLKKQIRDKLLTLGIDESHMPESFKKLFDTLRLVVVLGMIEGNRTNFIERFSGLSPNSEIYHIGAVYFNNNSKRLSFMRGSYFWRACLEKCEDPVLIEHYHNKYDSQTSLDVLNSNPEFSSYSSTKKFVVFVNDILDRKLDHIEAWEG